MYVIPYLNDLFAALFFKKHKIWLYYSNIRINITIIQPNFMFFELIISSKPKKVKIGTRTTINVLSLLAGQRYIASVDF